jgi:hypothetical protein
MLGQTAADGGVRAQAEQITAEAAKKHTGNTQKRRNGELLARAIRGAK